MIGVKEAENKDEIKIDFATKEINENVRLKDLVDLFADNEECAILYVKPGKMRQLMALGCFDGDEEYIRLTKSDTVTCTVWKRDLKATSWYWGRGRKSLITPLREKQGQMIQDCIEKDFGIKCQKW